MALLRLHILAVVSYDVVNALLDALIGGLHDYTIDERGDVGSWVRIACMQGLTEISDLLFRVFESKSRANNESIAGELGQYLPYEKFHAIVAGVLKQGVERLDNVRQEAGESFMKLLDMTLPDGVGLEQWRLHGLGLLRELFRT